VNIVGVQNLEPLRSLSLSQEFFYIGENVCEESNRKKRQPFITKFAPKTTMAKAAQPPSRQKPNKPPEVEKRVDYFAELL